MSSKDRNEKLERVEELRKSPDRLCRTNSGVDLTLEEYADAVLAKGREGVVKHSELRDYLSPSQLITRWKREVYPKQGFPEKAFYQGIYRREYNENSRGTTSSKHSPGMMDEGE